MIKRDQLVKLKNYRPISINKMPKNKVLTLYQKAKICEMSLKPGFNQEQCENCIVRGRELWV